MEALCTISEGVTELHLQSQGWGLRPGGLRRHGTGAGA